MDGLILLRPMWLLGLVPLALIAFWQHRRQADAGGWERVMSADMLRTMATLGVLSGRETGWQRSLAPLALLALLCGMSGPAIPRADTPVLAQDDAAIIAIDMSRSVAAGPDLQQAQLAAAGLLQGLAGRPVGLILYAGEAYLAAAPTADPATLETLVAVLEADTVPGRGSQPSAALGMAATLLADVPHGDVILISDGGGIDATTLAAADRLAAQAVRLSALTLDNPAPDATPAAPEELGKLLRNKGAIMPADKAPELAGMLSRGHSSRRDPDLTALQYRDLGPFLAALALLPLMVMLRRRA
ncbi:VWA domain-containing protein [Paracoccus seriniphilus]|uniref:VWA domain-containing protein n=1 Tax=Paracoccus seriniphilus TaxID=184748 RepID=UPI003565D54B